MNHPRAVTAWRKSSHSKSSYCVEVAREADTVVVRDSKDRPSGSILLSCQQWSRMLSAIKAEGNRFR